MKLNLNWKKINESIISAVIASIIVTVVGIITGKLFIDKKVDSLKSEITASYMSYVNIKLSNTTSNKQQQKVIGNNNPTVNSQGSHNINVQNITTETQADLKNDSQQRLAIIKFIEWGNAITWDDPCKIESEEFFKRYAAEASEWYWKTSSELSKISKSAAAIFKTTTINSPLENVALGDLSCKNPKAIRVKDTFVIQNNIKKEVANLGEILKGIH